MPVALYLRVSTDDQRLDSQERELRTYCRRRKWSSPAIYKETASGSASTTRPVLERLLSDVRAGTVDTIVCFKLDRLGRSLMHLALILDELTRHKVGLVCTSQGIDTTENNPAGRLQLGVLMAVAEFERELIRERTLSGLAAAKARGKRLGRPPSLRRHSAAVQKLRKAGKSIRAIAGELGLPVSSVHSLCPKGTPR